MAGQETMGTYYFIKKTWAKYSEKVLQSERTFKQVFHRASEISSSETLKDDLTGTWTK